MVETICGKQEMTWHQTDTAVGCEWQMCNNQHMQTTRSLAIYRTSFACVE